MHLQVVCTTMCLLHRLILSSNDAGRALVPYFRQVGSTQKRLRASCQRSLLIMLGALPHALQILPALSTLVACEKPARTRMAGEQHAGRSVAHVVAELLQALEVRGGPGSFRQIKLMIPTAESHSNVA